MTTYQHAIILPSENTIQALKKSYAKYNGDKIHDTNFQKSITCLLKIGKFSPKIRYVQLKKTPTTFDYTRLDIVL